jgi:hypothetical protein
MPECNAFIADAGGQLELGPVVGKTYSQSEATGSMGDALKWLHLAACRTELL